jgi:general secretion pathway protein M
MMAWLQRQSPRDRLTLTVGAVVVVLAALWAFAWQPLMDSRRSLRMQVAQAEQHLTWMREVGAELKQQRNTGAASTFDRAGQSLLALADSSVREAGLGSTLKRVEPVSAGRVNVWFEGAGFDQLAGWAEGLAARFGVSVDELTVDRADGTGVVNARVTLIDVAGK